MEETKSTDSSFFSVRGVRKALGGRTVLDGVDIEIPRGKTTVVLGGSGTGKSVLLKHLCGLLRPDEGEVVVDGTATSTLTERQLLPLRRRIGILFQDGALFDSMTVAENVAFPLVESGEEKAAIADRVDEVLESVGLADDGKKMPARLSGGMRKRVALARALAGRPACVLCDEPTAGLDPVWSDTISRLIRSTTHDGTMTAVVVTHDLPSMRTLADRVVFLERGRVRFEGTVAELEASDDEAIRQFLAAGK